MDSDKSAPPAAPQDLMPPPCMVVLVGASGSGKTTWSQARWPHHRALSSDAMRELLTDSERSQWASAQAFELMRHAARLRLELGQRVIIDATSARPEDRRQWLTLAREHGVPACAVWLDVPEQVCRERQSQRTRQVPDYAIARQLEELGETRALLEREGWDMILRVDEHMAPGEAECLKSWVPPALGPAGVLGVRSSAEACDIVGDVHGCYDELMALVQKLGWQPDGELHAHPEQRLLVFVGDLVDRGPKSAQVLDWSERMVAAGRALLVRGNHDDKLRRYLCGNKVKVDEHLQTTLDELEAMPAPQREDLTRRAIALIDASPMWALFGTQAQPRCGSEAALVVAHAAWKPSLMRAKEDKVRWFCLYGPSTGKKSEAGYPERLDWKTRYPEQAPLCVTGHTPFSGEVEVRQNTMCLDTACVFGERLTALRWPELEVVSVDALQVWAQNDGRVAEQPELVAYPPRGAR